MMFLQGGPKFEVTPLVLAVQRQGDRQTERR